MRIGVMASGSGTNFRAIVESGISVAVLVVDRACMAEQIADEFSIPRIRVSRAEFGSPINRAAYSTALIEVLAPYELDLVVLAGFMTILDEGFVHQFENRILNTHPSLLPSFRGAHAAQMALDAGVKLTGCTIHVVTAALDDGPILAQEAVPVYATDTEVLLQERIKEVERALYPQVIKEYMASWPNGH